MKKYYFLIIVSLILGLVLTGCSLLTNVGQVPTNEQSGISYLTKAGTEAEPESFPLYAGQDWEVGEVLVWNNEIEVCVKYRLFDGTGEDPENVVGDGWGLTETHLAVVADFADIPTNKSGNPQVGHFPFGNDELTGVAEDGPYCIHFGEEEGELDVGCDDTLVIAAHAVVCKLGEVEEVTLVSDELTTMTAGYTTVDPEIDPLNREKYESMWKLAVDLTSPNPNWYSEIDPPFEEAFWISSANSLEGSGLDSQWRLFKEDFTIPSGAVNINGSLYMTADNAVEAYLNGISVGSTTYVYGSQPDPIESPTHYYFKFPQGPYNLALQADSNNTLAFVVRNWTGSATSNPTGLLYRMDYSYQLLECESAWAANMEKPEGQEGTLQFDGANWATYFQYTTSYWEEELTVLANGNIATSTNSLTAGHTYKFEASGTCNWREEGSPSGYLADASYWLRNDFYIGWRDQYSLAMWNGDFVNIPWVGTYEGPNAHFYEYEYTADVDGPVQFIFTDDGYSDNSGSLTLKIYSCF